MTYNEELCREKHENIDNKFDEIKSLLDSIDTRINWFYGVALLTLLSTTGTLAMFILAFIAPK